MENENGAYEAREIVYRQPPRDQSWWEVIKFALIALAIVIPVRMFVAEPFVVSGSSMFPTFINKDYLIVNKISYRLEDPKRYDVVVFKYPNDVSKFFIKRVLGLPGETIDIRGNNITITNREYPNGLLLNQPFIKNGADNKVHLKLKGDEYFVMGDNRPASSDSRVWGPLKRKFITGKVFLRLLPLQNIDLSPGEYIQTEN